MSRNLLPLLWLLAVAHAGPVRAEITQCTAISSLPTTIASAGIYCLNQDLATAIASGAAINVSANNVVIDCNGHRIGGLAAGAATDTDGIVASGRQNLTIRNCGLRGFRMGLYVTGGGGHLVEHNRIDNNTFYGAVLTGSGNVVRNNRILDTGGRADVTAIGLSTAGLGTSILDNQVSGVIPAGPGDRHSIGISVQGTGSLVARNHITEVYPAGAGTPSGINASGGGYGAFRENNVINSMPVTGLGVFGGGTGSICADNIVINFTTVVSACTGAGYNAAPP